MSLEHYSCPACHGHLASTEFHYCPTCGAALAAPRDLDFEAPPVAVVVEEVRRDHRVQTVLLIILGLLLFAGGLVYSTNGGFQAVTLGVCAGGGGLGIVASSLLSLPKKSTSARTNQELAAQPPGPSVGHLLGRVLVGASLGIVSGFIVSGALAVLAMVSFFIMIFAVCFGIGR